MAFREVRVFEVREVLRLWLSGLFRACRSHRAFGPSNIRGLILEILIVGCHFSAMRVRRVASEAAMEYPRISSETCTGTKLLDEKTRRSSSCLQSICFCDRIRTASLFGFSDLASLSDMCMSLS
jgi:hypothetical protein